MTLSKFLKLLCLGPLPVKWKIIILKLSWISPLVSKMGEMNEISLKSENESESCSVVSSSLQPHRLYSPWNSPGQNTGVGSLSLFQWIFSTQGSNPGLLHCGWILYQLSHQGSPRILEWVAYPLSSGSSQPRNPTRVSCIAGGFFTNWATREALMKWRGLFFLLRLIKRKNEIINESVVWEL